MWPDRVSNPGPLTYESSALVCATRPGQRKVYTHRVNYLTLYIYFNYLIFSDMFFILFLFYFIFYLFFFYSYIILG